MQIRMMQLGCTKMVLKRTKKQFKLFSFSRFYFLIYNCRGIVSKYERRNKININLIEIAHENNIKIYTK